ncbi:Cytochrome P, partial [Parasponia andersonii]
MLLHLGCVPTLVVSSADLARDIVKKHDIVFSNRPQTIAGKILLYGCQDPAFSPYEEAVGLVDRIRRACLRSKTTDNYSIINLTEMLVTTSNNVISRCALGQALGEDDDVGGLLRNVMIYFTAFCLGDFFPSLRWVDVVRGFIGRLEATFR